jgi:fermentation-respiration switch protein FrsA (DUF1100 family)
VLLRLLATLVCAYGGIVGALFLGQRRLLYRPGNGRPVLGELGQLGVREVAVTTRDGLSLRSWFLPPAAGRPVVLYFHGNGGHIGRRGERLRRFAGQGYGVLMLEYRGYGGNPGKPSEAGLYADAEAALAFLERRSIAAERLVLWGESLGSAIALYLAAGRPVAAIVLEAPFTSVAALAQLHYPFVPAAILVRDRFDCRSRIARIISPLLVLHGGSDRIVPIRFGHELFAAAPSPKESWFEPRARHENLAAFGALDAAIAFIERQLPTGATGLVAAAPNFA